MSFQRSGVSTRGIGFELERLRRAAGLTLKDVGRGLGVSEATVSRLENGKRDTTSEEVASILTILGVTGAERERLITQARNDNAGVLVSPLLRGSLTYQSFEQTASKITNFELMLIPGLAQTPDYAQAVISTFQFHESEPEIETRVADRLARQAILTRSTPPELQFILTEAALRLPMGGCTAMAQQVHHLTQFAGRPNVTINVIPAKVIAHPGLTGAFVIMSFDDAPTVAHVESRTAGTFTDDPLAVTSLQQTADKLLELSLNPVESIRLMTSIVEDLSRT